MLEKIFIFSKEMAEIRALAPLVNHTITAAVGLLEASYGVLVLLNDETTPDLWVGKNSEGQRIPQPEHLIDQGLLEQVLQSRSVIYGKGLAEDQDENAGCQAENPAAAYIYAPLIAHNRLLGVVYLGYVPKEKSFETGEIELANYFASYAAVCIENVSLHESLEGRVEERTQELQELNLRLGQEILDKQKVENQLRRLIRAVEQSPTTVMITDLEGHIEYVNPTFTRLTGYTEEEVLGEKPNLLKSGENAPQVYREMWETITSGSVWRGEIVNRKKDGALYWEETVIAPVRDVDGEITHFVAVKEDITERKRSEEELKRLATIDALTNLWNRHYFFYHADQIFKQARRYDKNLSALMIDLDHFKVINDQYGHVTGDLVLKTIAQYLKSNMRDADILGRYGGEEFVMVLPHTPLNGALEVGERLWNYVRHRPVQVGGLGIPVTISIGVAELDFQHMEKVEHLLDRADRALYAAKESGRDQVAFWASDKPTPQRLLGSQGHFSDKVD